MFAANAAGAAVLRKLGALAPVTKPAAPSWVAAAVAGQRRRVHFASLRKSARYWWVPSFWGRVEALDGSRASGTSRYASSHRNRRLAVRFTWN